MSYTDRIGLRYLDAVFPKSDETVRDYLSGSILGLTEKIDDTIVHSFSETLVKRENVFVRSRVIIQDGEVGFPPDLQPMTLSLAERFRPTSGTSRDRSTRMDGANQESPLTWSEFESS